MKLSCPEIEESLWEHARTGSELDGYVLRHVAGCPACARAFQEARQILCAASDNYLDSAPDCRSAVMARIGNVRSRTRRVWTYACAAAIAVVILAVGLALHRPSTQPQQVALTAPTQHKVPPVYSQRTVLAPSLGIRKQPTPSRDRALPPAARHRHRTRPIYHIRPSRPRQFLIVAKVTPPAPKDVTPALRQPTPVAAVVVTGVVDDRTSDMSYAYRERDPVTGVTTECSVTRSGDSVQIRMESTPSGNAPPVKGSMDHENTSNA